MGLRTKKATANPEVAMWSVSCDYLLRAQSDGSRKSLERTNDVDAVEVAIGQQVAESNGRSGKRGEQKATFDGHSSLKLPLHCLISGSGLGPILGRF